MRDAAKSGATKKAQDDFMEDLEVSDPEVIDRIMRSNLKELIARVGT